MEMLAVAGTFFLALYQFSYSGKGAPLTTQLFGL